MRAGVLTDGTNNSGPHGFSEILYAYSFGDGEQRQRLCGTDRERSLV